jgi:hypothetical protein
MTPATKNKINMEPEPEEIWREWQDGDDDQLWFEGYQTGYYDGVVKAIEIINSVRDTPNVERVPFHLTMSAVVATLREIAKGK